MNTVDLISDAKTSAEEDNKLYARAVVLLQNVNVLTQSGGKVGTTLLHKIQRLLEDNYNQALK